MQPLNLRELNHPVFEFIRPTSIRINKSVAWEVRCKRCGEHQLVGSSQVKTGRHASCINCQLSKELQNRRMETPHG